MISANRSTIAPAPARKPLSGRSGGPDDQAADRPIAITITPVIRMSTM